MRNKGMFDLIYPILDETTLQPITEAMKPYQEIMQVAWIDYIKRTNAKIPFGFPKGMLESKRNLAKVQRETVSDPDAETTKGKMSKQQKYYKKNIKSKLF